MAAPACEGAHASAGGDTAAAEAQHRGLRTPGSVDPMLTANHAYRTLAPIVGQLFVNLVESERMSDAKAYSALDVGPARANTSFHRDPRPCHVQSDYRR